MEEKPKPINDLCAAYGNRPDALIEILHDVQDERGAIPQAVIPEIARALNLSRAEVHGVVTFYHDFRHVPAGQHVVKICRAESCQAMGGRALEAHAKKALNLSLGETTPDGKITLEPVYCLGNCALSPAIMIDGRLVGRVDARRFDQVIGELQAEAAE